MLKTIFFTPLYNALIFILNTIPGADIGIAIIILTLIVKIIIFPLYTKSIRTQIKMKEIEPEIKKIKEKYKDNNLEQTRQIMELYKANKVNPFTSLLVVIIQIPIILSLFYVFKDSFNIHSELIYSFISTPTQINPYFLNIIDITKSNWILAFLTGITQFIQVNLTLPKPDRQKNESGTFKGDLARSMDIQMRYVMPIIIIVISLSLPSAVAIYWVTSNIITLAYEVFVRRKIKASGGKLKPV